MTAMSSQRAFYIISILFSQTKCLKLNTVLYCSHSSFYYSCFSALPKDGLRRRKDAAATFFFERQKNIQGHKQTSNNQSLPVGKVRGIWLSACVQNVPPCSRLEQCTPGTQHHFTAILYHPPSSLMMYYKKNLLLAKLFSLLIKCCHVGILSSSII